ncbi:MAG: S1C family serine protease [Burkholderiales bacterium]
MKLRELALIALSWGLVWAWPAAAQAPQDQPAAREEGAAGDAETERRIEATLGAVVRIRMRALADARSNATLGPTREGSGIVIEPGYVLTIGYLVIEPDSIEVTTGANRTFPATLAGYDHASGLGLLRVPGDLGVTPLALGESRALAAREPVIIIPAGGRETASAAFVMSRRQFTGSWEYLLESAIYTAPPNATWAGAALVNRELKLVGVGSLLVRDTVEPRTRVPGNMFVPTELLEPILDELKAHGRTKETPRPWLGLNTEVVQGRLFVTRVSPESPADQAGLKQGDVVIGIAGVAVKTHAELYRKLWSLGAAGVEVPIKILQDGEVRDVRVQSIDRTQYFKTKRAY